MILSASRRTDIPARFPDWLMNRLRAGTALSRNPMNPAQISRIPLTPDVVDCIVFWTKDPLPLCKYLDELDAMGYHYLFQFTITPYGRDLEPGLRDKGEIRRTMKELGSRLGSHRVFWRYDPVLLTGDYTLEYHRREFRRMAEELWGSVDRVIISFVDLYAKIRGRGILPLNEEQILELGHSLGEAAAELGIPIQTCCEEYDLSPFGIRRGGCLDREALEKACGYPLKVGGDSGQRKGCFCCQSVDIGMYDTCPNGCLYCYANHRNHIVMANLDRHDPAGELLIGPDPQGEIPSRAVRSHRREDQLGLY